MAFFHIKVNIALLLVIAFLSLTLVTAAVYSVEAFSSISQAYAEKAMQVEALSAELAEKQALADALQKNAEMSKEREQALAALIEKQREAAKELKEKKHESMAVKSGSSSESAPYAPYNPYRRRYWNPWW